MKPESRLEIAVRHLAEAEASVLRQKKIVKELKAGGHPIQGSLILLLLLEDARQNAKGALEAMQSDRGSA